MCILLVLLLSSCLFLWSSTSLESERRSSGRGMVLGMSRGFEWDSCMFMGDEGGGGG